MRKLSLLIPLLLAGCATANQEARIEHARSSMDSCRVLAKEISIQRASAMTRITDQELLIIMALVDKIAGDDMWDGCDDYAIAIARGVDQLVGKYVDGTFGLGQVTLGLIGLDLLVDGVVDLGSDDGTTTNIHNSRVVSDSSGSSASGEGLGFGHVTTIEGSQGQGGITPRQHQNRDASDIHSPSQSGTNDLDDLFGNDGAVLLPEIDDGPVLLPTIE